MTQSISPRSHLRPSKPARHRVSKIASARDTIAGFDHGMDVVGLTYGQFSVVITSSMNQVARLREAQKRIGVEGLIIADPKGYPIPHPAIAIERAAQVEIRAWGSRLRANRSARR